MANYFSMNNLPIGTRLSIKSTGKVGELIQIYNFPTMFKIKLEDGKTVNVKTNEIELIESETNI